MTSWRTSLVAATPRLRKTNYIDVVLCAFAYDFVDRRAEEQVMHALSHRSRSSISKLQDSPECNDWKSNIAQCSKII